MHWSYEPAPIYRIPPYILGPRVYLANEVTDRQPWATVAHNIEPLWAETMGEGKTVAILDTGLWKHRDLPEPAFVENFTRSRSVYDIQGHGTHTAGTVGARLDGWGVVGWAPKCNLGCVKVLGDDGAGTSIGIARGIYYAAEHGAQIINLSLGGGYDQNIEQACRDAIQAGIFIICAAGNEGYIRGVNTIGWPARLKETLAIASYRKDGRISEYSSRGPEVDMAFPGEDILSTWPNNTFREISGTSMACPAACGLTALMLSYTDAAEKAGKQVTHVRNNRELRELWQAHGQDMGTPGKDTSFGWGTPDAHGIVRAGVHQAIPDPEPVPGDPEDPSCTTGPGLSLFGGLTIAPHECGGKKGLFVYTDPSVR